MSRTERDVMRGKRIALYNTLNMAARYAAGEHDSANRLFDEKLRVNHVYEHWCSPYCLIHQFKRIDRKKYRARVKDALRHGNWHEAQHLRPKDLYR